MLALADPCPTPADSGWPLLTRAPPLLPLADPCCCPTFATLLLTIAVALPIIPLPQAHDVVGLLFEITQGYVDRGADIAWLAQYPIAEVVFPPGTALEVRRVRDEGSIVVFECSATVNQHDMPMSKVRTVATG